VIGKIEDRERKLSVTQRTMTRVTNANS